MELDGLLTDVEPLADLSVGQSFGTGERDLRFPTAQVAVADHAFDGLVESLFARK